MASLQAVAARPVACRAHAVAFRPSQAARVAPALRRSVLVRADPIEVVSSHGPQEPLPGCTADTPRMSPVRGELLSSSHV